ncbi:MAG: sulfotransferase family protein [Rubrobacteraceae bacterium]
MRESVRARPLFVAGTPQRSGTTALANYLNLHPEILICIERYKYAPRRITPDLFTFERILDYREGETNIPRERHVELLERKDPSKLKWIGDKRPAHVKRMKRLSLDNPGARFIVIHRSVEEVGESFQARARNPKDDWPHDFAEGIRRWNLALKRAREFVESGSDLPVLILPYHDFFHGDGVCVPLLSRFLEVEFDEGVREEWNKMSLDFEKRRRPKEPLTGEQRSLIRENKDHENEKWMSDLIERQYAGIR